MKKLVATVIIVEVTILTLCLSLMLRKSTAEACKTVCVQIDYVTAFQCRCFAPIWQREQSSPRYKQHEIFPDGETRL